jgi:hypothetical protein
MTTRSVKLGDYVCNRMTDAWNFPQAILGNVFKRLRERESSPPPAYARAR